METAQRLAPVSATPRLDAELLMAHALGVSRERLLLGPDGPVPDAFEALLARRLAHEPVAYIVGTRAFWTLNLMVTPAVLIPRPDSETLIETALADHRAGRWTGNRAGQGGSGPARILDLGTGSGALLLAALSEWPQATGVGIDLSPAALTLAHANARAHGLADRATFIQGDWTCGVQGRFDLVLCNPPYIASGARLDRQVADYEPHMALFAGEDGLADYRRLAPALSGVLATRGLALFEIGHDQGFATRQIFASLGYATRLVADLEGRDRCLGITFPENHAPESEKPLGNRGASG